MVRHLQDVGREVGAPRDEVRLRGRLDVPRQEDRPACRGEGARTREPLFSGERAYVSGPGWRTSNGTPAATKRSPASSDLDRDAAAGRRLERLVEEEVPRRSPREVDAVDRQELQGREEAPRVVGVRMREDDRVERDGPERGEARQEPGPAEVVRGVERAAAVHEDAPPVGHDRNASPCPTSRATSRASPGRSAAEGRAEARKTRARAPARAARRGRRDAERPGRGEEEREERRLGEERRRDDADGAERVEEAQQRRRSPRRGAVSGPRAKAAASGPARRSGMRSAAAKRKRLASGTTTRFERSATNGTTWKTVAWIGKTQSSAPSVAAMPSARGAGSRRRSGAAKSGATAAIPKTAA